MEVPTSFCFLLLLALTASVQVQTVISGSQPKDSDACFCLEEFAKGLYAPVGATFFEKDRLDEVVIVEQRGTARLLVGKKVSMFMDIRNQVVSSADFGESRGLLSMVASPDYSSTGKIYAYYIRNVDGNDYAYISEFTAINGKVDPKTERFLLRVYQPFKHGNGGPMVFGDDGFLYIATGDGGAKDDSLGNAQNKASFHGSVLRIDVTSGLQDFTRGESGVAKAYGVPADNPFVNDTQARDELFAYGFRNPWGCSVDSKERGGTGKVYCAETGTSMYGEIDVIEAGKNYGWNIKEGNACFNSSVGSCKIENEGKPVHVFKHQTHHALVGGYVYRGQAFPKLKGRYVFGDVVTGKTYTLQEETPGNWVRHDFPTCALNKCPGSAQARPSSHTLAFAQDLKGELYLLMVKSLVVNDGHGAIYKMRPQTSSSNRLPASPAALSLALAVSWFLSSRKSDWPQ